jgi:adenylate/guanylate cyclase family protein
LYAALRMQEEMHRYADLLRQKGYSPLLMRVGINTGEVVVRSIRKDDLHADYVPVGHSTNLAARIEQLAAPGSILVTDYTSKLTDGYFAFKNLGHTQIKGVKEPLNVYELLGAGPLWTRLQVSARRGLTVLGHLRDRAALPVGVGLRRGGRSPPRPFPLCGKTKVTLCQFAFSPRYTVRGRSDGYTRRTPCRRTSCSAR